MTDTQLLVATLLLAPMLVLGLVAMVRGYHLTVKLFRQDRQRKDQADGQR